MIDLSFEPLRGYRALWRVQPQLPQTIRDELRGESVMLAHLLHCRGYRSIEEIRGFREGVAIAYDPFLVPDMAEAVERIVQARDLGEKVAVYGDFDCDGITAVVVLEETLRAIGIEPIVAIPHRQDGHGLHPETLARLRDAGVKLIVTADTGIVAIDEVQVARGLGIDVIVTDHHEPSPDGRLPDCPTVAPTRLHSSYPFRGLCGAGVVYKLAQGLARRLPGELDPDDLLDLVALGTVADVVPLRDENRTIVTAGLNRLQTTRRRGLLALFRVAGVEQARIDPISIGFYLAPRINAANRMASPQLAYDLLTASDDAEAERLAHQLSDLNRQRQALVEAAFAALRQEIGDAAALATEIAEGRKAPVLVTLGAWPPGISGLLATKLVEAYGLPAFVGTNDGETVVVSARGTPGARIDELLESCEASRPGGLFLGHGGHSRAGGFRLEATRWDETREAIEACCGRLPHETVGAIMEIDAEVALRQLTFEGCRSIESLAPFGMEFSEPLFLSRGVVLQSKTPMGGDKHARVRLRQGTGSIGGVLFGAPPQFLGLPLGTRLDVVFHAQLNRWNGTVTPQAQIRDWRISPEG